MSPIAIAIHIAINVNQKNLRGHSESIMASMLARVWVAVNTEFTLATVWS